MGYSHKLKKTALTEWKDWYINYDYLCTLFNDEKKFIEEFNNEAAKVNGFFIAAEKTVLEAKDRVLKKKAASEGGEETRVKVDYASDNFADDSSSSTDLGEPVWENEDKYENQIKNDLKAKVEDCKVNFECEEKKAELLKNENGLTKKNVEIEKTTEIKSDENGSKKQPPKSETIIEIDDTNQGEEIPTQEKKKKKSKGSSIFERTKNIFADKSKSIFKNNIFRKKYDLTVRERDFLDFIAALKHIIAFRNINLLGFRSILNKYDKEKKRNLSLILMPQIERCNFNFSRRIDSLYSEVSQKYAYVYHKNNPEKAKKILKGVNRHEKSDPKYFFLAGVAVTAFIFTHFFIYPQLKKEDQIQFYQSIGSIIVGFVLFSACLITLKKYKINYNYIFGFVHGSQFGNNIFLFSSATFLLIHQICSLYVFELTKFYIVLVYLVVLVFPFDLFYRSSRFFLLSIIITISSPLPFFHIMFKHFIVADILLSYVGPFKTIILCTTGNKKYWFLILYFPYIRLIQCLRRLFDEGVFVHLLNALKYTLSIVVEAMKISKIVYELNDKVYGNSLHILIFLSSLYSFFWDLYFDWSIIRGNYTFPVFFYVFLVVYDFVCRFLWVFTTFKLFEINEGLVFLIEIFRRCLWLLVRIEQEHLNNCHKLKGVKFVDLNVQDLFYKKGYEPLETDYRTETEFETTTNEVDMVE